MMTHLRSERENIIKDINNVFRLIIELFYIAFKYIRNLFKQEKKLKKLKMEELEILRNFLNIKKKKIIIE